MNNQKTMFVLSVPEANS